MERSTVGIAFSALFVGLIVLLAGCMNPALSSEPGNASAGISIQQVPENVDEIVLTITASDMDTVEERISAGDDEISIEVPVGPDRTFTAETGNGLYSTSVVRDVPAGGIEVSLSFATIASVNIGLEQIPEGYSEFDLTVSAADITTIEETINAADDATSIDVPVGSNREFTVQSADGLYSASIVADVPVEGTTVTLSFDVASVTVNFDFFTDFSSQLSDYTLTVKWDNTGGITQLVSPGETSTTVDDVPIGTDRTFNVVAPTTTTTAEFPVIDFRGNSTADVSSSGASVAITLGIGETAILIPDPWNYRLVQVDDMSGTNWSVNNAVSPADAEVGPDGVIYVAGQSDSIEGLYALTSLADGLNPLDTGINGSLHAVGIDHENGVVYYGGGGGTPFLKRVSLSDGTPAAVNADLASFFSSDGIWGIAVDESGDLYVSGNGSDASGDVPFDGSPTVIKVDPVAPDPPLWTSQLTNLTLQQGSGHADIMYDEGRVLVTNPEGDGSNRIVVLDPDTGEVVESIGSSPVEETNPGMDEFYGPRRFVATNRSKLYVIDDAGLNNEFYADNRIVAFDASLEGSGWETYGSEGEGNDEFDFYLAY